MALTGDLGGGTTTVVRTSPAPTAAAPVADDGRLTVSEIYARAAPGVVQITSTAAATDNPSLAPFDQQRRPEQALGSGFVIDKTGHIVTNYHVIEGADEIEVSFSNQDTLSATIVGSDPSTDIAVLRVQSSSRGLAPLAFGNSDTVRVGDPVVAIGNPFGLRRTATAGIVSAVQERTITAPNGYPIDHVIQTDAQINSGNSGGPLLSARGEVIGVNSQIARADGSTGNVGIGFAVPSNTVKEVVAQLTATGKVDRAYLGISGSTVTAELARVFRLPVDEGVLVEGVAEGSAAAKAGLKGGTTDVVVAGESHVLGGDVIVAVGGRRVGSIDELRDALAQPQARPDGQRPDPPRHEDRDDRGHARPPALDAAGLERATRPARAGRRRRRAARRRRRPSRGRSAPASRAPSTRGLSRKPCSRLSAPARAAHEICGTFRGSLVRAKRSSTARAARVRRPGRACSRASRTRSARSASSSRQAASRSAASCSSSAVFRWIATRIRRTIMSPRCTGSPRCGAGLGLVELGDQGADGRHGPEPLQAAAQPDERLDPDARVAGDMAEGDDELDARPLERVAEREVPHPAAVGGDPVADRQRQHERADRGRGEHGLRHRLGRRLVRRVGELVRGLVVARRRRWRRRSPRSARRRAPARARSARAAAPRSSRAARSGGGRSAAAARAAAGAKMSRGWRPSMNSSSASSRSSAAIVPVSAPAEVP